MKITDWIKSLGRLLRRLVSFVGRHGNDIRDVVLKVIRDIEQVAVALGRPQLAEEIETICAGLDLDWLIRGAVTLDQLLGMNPFDFKMWLACARAAVAIAHKYGAAEIPPLDVLRSLVNGLYSQEVKKRS